MKKKIMLTITAAALATMMAIGGTIAWFTDEAKVTNVITMGNIEISLRETDESEELGYTEVGLQFGEEVPITPGAELEKDPYVVGLGDNDAWVRLQVISSGSATLVEGFSFADLVTFDSNWIFADGYYYYNQKVDSGHITPPLFDKVTIPTSWGNDYQNTELTIEIKAEAVQADNLAADSAQAAFAETAPAPAPTTTTAE